MVQIFARRFLIWIGGAWLETQTGGKGMQAWEAWTSGLRVGQRGEGFKVE